MTRQVRRLGTPGGIGAGQTATVSLPLGLTYHQLDIHMKVNPGGGAVDVATSDWGSVIDEIRLVKDGSARITVDAQDLLRMNRYHGIVPVPGVLTLYLSQPWLTTPGGQIETAYKTASGVANLSLEIDISTGTTVEELEIYATQSQGLPWGAHLQIGRQFESVGVTGMIEFDRIPRGAHGLLEVHFATDEIGEVDVEADGRVVLQSNVKGRAAQAATFGRIPQGNLTSIDFQNSNLLVDALPMALADFRIKADFTNTGNVAMYYSLIAPGNAA